MSVKIQTCGSFSSEEDLYTVSIAFEKHCITLDGLSREDMLELKSCIDCMLED